MDNIEVEHAAMLDKISNDIDEYLGSEDADELRCEIRELDGFLDQVEIEKTKNAELSNRYLELRAIAIRYRKEYRKLVNSRFVKLWLRARRLFGKKYYLYNDVIPKIDYQSAPKVNPKNQLFMDHYEELIAQIKPSNGSGYYQKASLRVGIITDLFMFNYYKDAVDLIYLSPRDAKRHIDESNLDLVLYVSCWHGMGYLRKSERVQDFDYFDNENKKRKGGISRAVEILEYAKDRGIKTVFQSIEDPVSYKRYLPIAKVADYIYTSASEMIERYIQDTGNRKVYSLPYGINPTIHNPIGFLKKWQWDSTDWLHGGVFFAGSWYPAYKKRCSDSRLLFKGVLRSEGNRLYLADRNLNRPNSRNFAFPPEFTPSIIPPFDHEELQKVHKLFNYSINLNTVIDSRTMCAMRVYEVQALGCLMLTNYSLSVSSNFPNLFTVTDGRETSRVLHGYTDQEIVNMQLESIRKMYSQYTVYDRLNLMFDQIGIEFRYPAKVVYVVSDESDNWSGINLRNIKFISRAEAEGTLTDEKDAFVIIADKPIGGILLMDMINAFKFVDVDYVRCVEDFRDEGAYDYICEQLTSSNSVLFNLNRVSYKDIVNGNFEGLTGFGIVNQKWGRLSETSKPRVSKVAIIIPTHNNCSFAIERCFRSLLRSSVFELLEVYFYGSSSNQLEMQILKNLEDNFENVHVKEVENTAYSSIADTYNVALKEVTEKYVCLLNPYVELIGDALAKMINRLDEDESYDAVYGGYRQCRDNGSVANVKNAKLCEGKTPEERIARLIDDKFVIPQVGAWLLRKSSLCDKNICFTDNGDGDEQLFLYKIILEMEKISSIKDIAAVRYPIPCICSESINDTMQATYFSEEATLKYLKDKDVVESYIGLVSRKMLEEYSQTISKMDLKDMSVATIQLSKIQSLYN